MIAYILGLIASLANCLFAAYDHNLSATLGWLCACLWLVRLINERNEKE